MYQIYNFNFKYFYLDGTEEKPEEKTKILKKREMDEESSDNKKIKKDEKPSEVGESELVISSKEVSSKKNVCNPNLFLVLV